MTPPHLEHIFVINTLCFVMQEAIFMNKAVRLNPEHYFMQAYQHQNK